MIKIGGLYWGKPSEVAINAISKWDTIILNDSNTYSLIEQPNADDLCRRLKTINPNAKVGISTNSYSCFVKNNAPSLYFPIQVKAFEAANRLNAWLMVDGKHITAWQGTWVYDLRNSAFRSVFSEIINMYVAKREPHFVFFDELHSTIRFLATQNGITPDQLPSDAEWSAATMDLLKLIVLPFMGNGTYDVSKYHKKKSRGRYLQRANDIPDLVQYLKYDLQLPVTQRYSVINPSLPVISKPNYAKVADGLDITIQYYTGGGEHYSSYVIESF